MQCIVEIRKALGDDSRHPHFIKTIPKIGYRFIGPVELFKLSQLTTIHTEITSVQVEQEVTLEDDDTPTTDMAVSSAAVASPSVITLSFSEKDFCNKIAIKRRPEFVMSAITCQQDLVVLTRRLRLIGRISFPSQKWCYTSPVASAVRMSLPGRT